MRHWCAVARLIETKVQNKTFEPYTVRNWLGHTSIKTTETYIQYAEQYYSQCKESWIKRAMRSPYGEKSTIINEVKVQPELGQK
jgi:integrase